MGYRNLQHFIKALKKTRQLSVINAKVSPILEITEIADRTVKKNGNALLFKNVKGSKYPLLINAFGTYERMGMALGEDSLDDIYTVIKELINLRNYIKFPNQLKSVPHAARLVNIFPIKVKNAACQQVVEEPDLSTLPIMKCWPGDGGRFITLPLVITKDPVTGQQNMGMYRMHVYDKKTTGMHWHLHKDGREIYNKYRELGMERMPISVAIGCDPATIYAATAPLPKMIDEMMFAGYLRKRPVRIVKSITNDIYVPAEAEFILEGYVDLSELRDEGPFGDHTGYYSIKDKYPVFHLTKITHRENPVYIATIVGKPPMEDCYMGKATERIFLPLLQMIAPEIINISFPLEGVFHNCVVVSIDKKYPGHAKKVMNTVWGMGQMMYTKMVIVVDKQIDPSDMKTVMWKVFNNIDAARDLVISNGPLDALDHSSDMPHLGNRIGIDATKTWPEEGYTRVWPEDIEMSQKIKDKVTLRWDRYGLD